MARETVPLTKLEGARRQLAEAIRLFFERREPVAIHTLASAAHQVLHDLARAKGSESNLRSAKFVRPGMEREYFAMLNSPQNFLKHANTDPDASFEFRPGITQYFLFDAVETYRAVVGSVFHEAHIFSVWFTLKNPDLLKPSPYRDNAIAVLKRGVDLDDFEMVLQVLNAPGRLQA
jgi:hypothetical protein